MDWFRFYVGTATDPKFLVVARKSGSRLGDVLAIWQMLLERACQADERGSIEGFDWEAAEVHLDLEEGHGDAIRESMEHRGLIRDGRIVSWEKRQPKREDNSTERVRAFRERKNLEPETQTESQCNDVKRSVTHGNARLDKSREEKKEDKTAPTEQVAPSASHSEPEHLPDDPVFCLLTLNDKSEFEIRESFAERLQESYPAVAVRAQLLAIRAWCDTNPAKRKTRRGVMSFVNRWLSKEQDRGGVKTHAPFPDSLTGWVPPEKRGQTQ